jgi:transcription elongation GreA/GreB family factor
MDKRWLVDQLRDEIRRSVLVAERERDAAEVEAREGATPAEKREDARTALEYAGLARGQSARAERARDELAALERFQPGPAPTGASIGVGAVVELEGDEEGRTFFLAPVGAGIELCGPGGDGFLSVVTPRSPMGRAVIGRRVGDEVEVEVRGNARLWTITYAC